MPIPMKMAIKKMTTTPGNVHDSLHDFGEFDHLLGDRRGQVYADSAYTQRAQVPTKTMTRNWVKKTIESCIGHIATRH